jgi:hypothetical protein
MKKTRAPRRPAHDVDDLALDAAAAPEQLRYRRSGIAARRAEIFERVFMDRQKAARVARDLGLHRHTVERDRDALRRRTRQQVMERGVEALAVEIGLYLKSFDLLAALALREFQAETCRRTRRACLETVLAALDAKSDFMVEVGLFDGLKAELDAREPRGSSDTLSALRDREAARAAARLVELLAREAGSPRT